MRLLGWPAAMASSVALSQAKGSTRFSFAVSMSEAMRAHAAAPSSWPANNALLRFRAIGRARFSTPLLSMWIFNERGVGYRMAEPGAD